MIARVRVSAALVVLAGALLNPATSHAQSAAVYGEPAAVASPTASLSAVPTLEATQIALRPLASAERTTHPAVVQQRRGMGRGQVLMIVGGAAFLAGAIIGDDAGTIMMIGGAGIGLWGLYLYLQ